MGKPADCARCGQAKPAARVTLASGEKLWLCKACVYASAAGQSPASGLDLPNPNQPSFSMDLEQLMTSTAQTQEIPNIVSSVIGFVESKCMFLEGLYRQSGSSQGIEERKELYNRGRHNSMLKNAESDPHAVAGLLKLWFRSLPRPLLTFELFEQFIALADVPPPSVIGNLQALVRQLPDPNRFVAHALFIHLRKVADCAETNKMGPENLAIVFGPNILKKRGGTALDDMANSSSVTAVTTTMIQFAHEIFSFIGPERERYRQMRPSQKVVEAATRAAASAPPAKGPTAALKKGRKPARDSINF